MEDDPNDDGNGGTGGVLDLDPPLVSLTPDSELTRELRLGGCGPASEIARRLNASASLFLARPVARNGNDGRED